MEKKDWKDRFSEVFLISSEELTDNGVMDYRGTQNSLLQIKNFIEQEIDRAFNRGYAECKKDIAIGVGFAEDPEFSELVSRVAKKLN